MAKIELQNVSYIYGESTPFEKKAIDNLSLSFEAGKINAVIGHTGSGKSTLVQMLNGLLKPTSGRILLDGEDIWADKKKMQNLCFKVGLCFQYPEYQLFEETVYRDIAFGPTNMKCSEQEIKKRVLDAAHFCGIDDELLDKSPFEISGGQMRRVAIAGVMAMTPEVLILDEPAAGLDPTGRSSIFGGICEYRRKTGATVIIVSHSMEDIARYCEHVAVLYKSKLFALGTCEEIFSRGAELEEIGLSLPQITRVVRKMRELGAPVPENIFTVGDAYRALLPYIKAGVGDV